MSGSDDGGRGDERFRALFETMAQGVVFQDAEGHIVDANAAAEEILGLSLDEMTGRTSADPRWRAVRGDGSGFPASEHPATIALATRQPVRDVLMGVFNPRVEEYRWLSVNAVPLFEMGDCAPYCVYTTFTDITDRIQAARALRQSEEHYRQLFGNMNEGVALHEVVYDAEGRPVDYLIRDVNPRFEQIVGLSRDQVVGRVATDAYGTEEAPYLDVYARVAETREPTWFETYFPPMRKHFLISAFSPAEGQFATVFTDITRRKRDEERLEALYRTAEIASSSLDAEDIARAFLDSAVKRLGPANAAISLVNPAGTELVPVSDYGFPEGFWTSIPPLAIDAPSVAARVFRTGEPVLVDDLDDPSVPEGTREAMRLIPEVRSVMVAPLRARGESVGVAHLGWSTPASVSSDEADFFVSLASEAAVGILNARLYAAEHHIAETLQQALLVVPRRLPGVEVGCLYRSATEAAMVGGDFYDVFEIERGRIGLMLGDVMGKGIAAAALTVLVKSVIKTSAYKGLSPSQVMSETNGAIVRASEESTFVTVFFGELLTGVGTLTYCSGGQPPGMIRRADGSVEVLQCASPFVGAFANVSFDECETRLWPEDVLVLYTDGVIEARRDGELFGEQRLAELVATVPDAHDAPPHVIRAVESYAEGRLADDVAILSLSLKGES